MFWLVLVIIEWLVILPILARVGYLAVQKRRAKVHATPPKIAVNYVKIARLEIEFFGETKPNADSPVPPWCKSEAEVNGIDETGHLKNGTCNLNSSLGPACSKRAHQIRRNRANDHYMPLSTAVIRGIVNPYADQVYGQDGWLDEQGRPY